MSRESYRSIICHDEVHAGTSSVRHIYQTQLSGTQLSLKKAWLPLSMTSGLTTSIGTGALSSQALPRID
jgi:hypothetical protein